MLPDRVSNPGPLTYKSGALYCTSSFIIRQFLQSKKFRSVFKDGSRLLGLFRKGKSLIIAKFHRTDLVICSHSKERKSPSYSQINTVLYISSYI